jgi:hypothetical protein
VFCTPTTVSSNPDFLKQLFDGVLRDGLGAELSDPGCVMVTDTPDQEHRDALAEM